MSGSFDDRGQLVLADGRLIFCVGKKKSGKSVMALLIFASYPGDKIVIDVAGDDGPMGDGVVELRGGVDELPKRWPEHKREYGPGGEWRPMTLRYVPDAGSATFLEDMDALVGLALKHGRDQHHAGRIGCCILIHEIGVAAPVNRTRPHMRRMLNSNRHHHVTGLMCGPRSQDIDPLIIAQSDVIYTFELMNPKDRRKLAESMGWNPADFDAAVHDLGLHEYLRYDSNEHKPDDGQPDIRLVHFPALPADVVKEVVTK